MDRFLQLLERVAPLAVFYPRWAQVLFVATFALVLLSLFAVVIGYSAASDRRVGFTRDGTLPALIVEARKHKGLKYVIESATMHVRLNDPVQTTNGGQLSADVHITYTIFALDRVGEQDFAEEYHAMESDAVLWLGGTEALKVTEPGLTIKKATLDLDVPAGHRRTVVTGARYVESLPLEPTRTVHGFTLTPDDDAWCYPNQADVIGELTIIIESALPFDNPGLGDAMLWDNSDHSSRQSTPNLRAYVQAAMHAVVHRWSKVLPSQTVGIRVRRAGLAPVLKEMGAAGAGARGSGAVDRAEH